MTNMPRFGYASEDQSGDSQRDVLIRARDTDLASAVRREQATAQSQGLPLSPAEAKEQVMQRIETEGAAEILPQYARIASRMGIHNLVDLSDEVHPEPKVRTASIEPTAPQSAGPDLAAMREQIAWGKENGVDVADSESLLAHLESNPE